MNRLTPDKLAQVDGIHRKKKATAKDLVVASKPYRYFLS